MISFVLNEQTKTLDVDPNMPLLWVLRDILQLTGTKFGCGKGLCGACTVHIDNTTAFSCMTPLKDVAGKQISTIEGLANGAKLHPVQQAWIDENVSQCGYCQSGQIMSAVALLRDIPQPNEQQINAAMAKNLCRCGSYQRIKKAIQHAAKQTPTRKKLSGGNSDET